MCYTNRNNCIYLFKSLMKNCTLTANYMDIKTGLVMYRKLLTKMDSMKFGINKNLIHILQKSLINELQTWLNKIFFCKIEDSKKCYFHKYLVDLIFIGTSESQFL